MFVHQHGASGWRVGGGASGAGKESGGSRALCHACMSRLRSRGASPLLTPGLLCRPPQALAVMGLAPALSPYCPACGTGPNPHTPARPGSLHRHLPLGLRGALLRAALNHLGPCPQPPSTHRGPWALPSTTCTHACRRMGLPTRWPASTASCPSRSCWRGNGWSGTSRSQRWGVGCWERKLV